jgi:hypothetical protein
MRRAFRLRLKLLANSHFASPFLGRYADRGFLFESIFSSIFSCTEAIHDPDCVAFLAFLGSLEVDHNQLSELPRLQYRYDTGGTVSTQLYLYCISLQVTGHPDEGVLGKFNLHTLFSTS